MKITVDTNFLISATQWNYSVSHRLLRKLVEKEFEIFTTKEILEEFSKVLKRDFKYCSEEIDEIIEKLLPLLVLVEPQEKLKAIIEDPEDNKILECAIESFSEYLITYDKHLLKLKEFAGVKIIKPEELISFV